METQQLMQLTHERKEMFENYAGDIELALNNNAKTNLHNFIGQGVES